MNEMKHFLQWICKKLLNWDLVLVDRKEWEQSRHNNLQYLRQYRPEKEIIVELTENYNLKVRFDAFYGEYILDHKTVATFTKPEEYEEKY